MKVSKTFRLSEEAIAIINKQENQSKYLEDLILGNKTTPANSTDLLSIEAMLDERFMPLVDLLEERFQKLMVHPTGIEPKAPDPVTGYPCCTNDKKPCKHWQWDGVKQSYTNTLTGEVREIYL